MSYQSVLDAFKAAHAPEPVERTEPGQRNKDGLLIWAAWDFSEFTSAPEEATR